MQYKEQYNFVTFSRTRLDIDVTNVQL